MLLDLLLSDEINRVTYQARKAVLTLRLEELNAAPTPAPSESPDLTRLVSAVELANAQELGDLLALELTVSPEGNVRVSRLNPFMALGT